MDRSFGFSDAGRLSRTVGPQPSPGRRSRGLPRPAFGGRPVGPSLASLLIGLLLVVPLVASCAGAGASSVPTTNSAPTAPTATTAASDLVDIGVGLQGPAGLTASEYATGLANVSAFAIDEQGRLWVATGAFEDAGDDAVYLVPSAGATPIKVIRDLHTPLGLLWIGDELYVSSKDRVDAFRGFDGSAFASQRSVVTFPAGVGELNGLALSLIGRIMLGISSPTDATKPTSEYSAAVVSFLPDGSDLQVEASGIRAPVGLAYLPGTDELLVTMNQRDDLGDATPGDWLGLVQPGQDWGFPDCYGQGGTACTDSPLPLAVLDTHAAVSGLAIATGQLVATVGTSALVAEWSTGKVLAVDLAGEGTAVAQAAVAPFLTGLKNPMPLLLTADGTLYVGDWGTGTIYAIGA